MACLRRYLHAYPTRRTESVLTSVLATPLADSTVADAEDYSRSCEVENDPPTGSAPIIRRRSCVKRLKIHRKRSAVSRVATLVCILVAPACGSESAESALTAFMDAQIEGDVTTAYLPGKFQDREERLIRLHLELLMLAHHVQKPIVGFTSRVDAVGRRESEGDACGRHACLRILAADG